MHKIILFEINELPWEVVDWWTELNPKSPLAEIVNNSRNFDTYTVDEGELHPWSTWPTVHRGVSNHQHQIKDFGEDLADKDLVAFEHAVDVLGGTVRIVHERQERRDDLGQRGQFPDLRDDGAEVLGHKKTRWRIE